MAKKTRLDARLLQEGFFADEKEARAFLMEGKVFVDGARETSGARLLSPECVIAVHGLNLPYVSKGGLKLSGALDAFGLSPEGRVCIDAGASTGGFTDCLVQRGARLVYAVDTGYGQLAGKLRQDARVVNMEKVNLGDEKLLSLDPVPDFGTADLSYLSLRKAVPLYEKIMRGQGELICLVKPLFEIEDAQARRTGEIEESAYAPLLTSLISELPCPVTDVTYSPVTGNAGTHEFFLRASFGARPAEDLSRRVEEAVAASARLAPYKKR